MYLTVLVVESIWKMLLAETLGHVHEREQTDKQIVDKVFVLPSDTAKDS